MRKITKFKFLGDDNQINEMASWVWIGDGNGNFNLHSPNDWVLESFEAMGISDFLRRFPSNNIVPIHTITCGEIVNNLW